MCRHSRERGIFSALAAVLSAAAPDGRQVCADSSRALPSWWRRVAGLRAHAQPDRAGRECVRRTERAAASPPGPAAHATAARARSRPRRLRRGFRRARCGLRGKGGPRPPAAIGSSTYAHSSARESAAQHSRSQRFLAAAAQPFFRATALSPSLPAPSASPSLLPPSSALRSPFPLPASRRSLPLSPSSCRPAFLFAQFQRLFVGGGQRLPVPEDDGALPGIVQASLASWADYWYVTTSFFLWPESPCPCGPFSIRAARSPSVRPVLHPCGPVGSI